PLGDLKSVAAAVRAAFPSAEWSQFDPKRATYLGSDFEIEISLDGAKSVDSIVLHVQGTGDPIPSILKLTEANGWLAIDCSTSESLEPTDPSYEGWQGFQELARDLAPPPKRRPRGREKRPASKSLRPVEMSPSEMSPGKNTQYWLERLREEAASSAG